jgi:LDH2 family malate/lactate/ureidoglycolate dehydrogenase
VLVPGDPEREMAADRKKNGIPVNAKVVEDLSALAQSLKLDFKRS